MAYKRNLRVLYYSGDSLKEKFLQVDSSSSAQGEDEDEDQILIFLCGKQFLPLIVVEDEDSEEEVSDDSTERIDNKRRHAMPEVTPLGKKDSENDSDSLDVLNSMSKFVDEELETKLHLDPNVRKPSNYDAIERDDNEEQLFSEIWNKPTQVSDTRSHISHTQGPPGLRNDLKDEISDGLDDSKTKRK